MLHLQNPDIVKELLNGNFGIEKESLRIDATGHLSRRISTLQSPNVTVDFSSAQTEINTDVHKTLHKALDQSRECTLQILLEAEEHGEMLWPFSSPCLINPSISIPMAVEPLVNAKGVEYRKYLSSRYGRKRMTYCGIHYNFSFPASLLEKEHSYCDNQTLQESSSAFYVQLAARLMQNGWLLNTLFNASPLADASLTLEDESHRTIDAGFSSFRNSQLGYWNHFVPLLDYSSIEAYCASIQKLADEGYIIAQRELYIPVRIKSRGEFSLQQLVEEGVSHIELRMLDLNPLDPYGLDENDAEFVHLFIVWCAALEDFDFSEKKQADAICNFKAACSRALGDTMIFTEQGSVPIKEAAMQILRSMLAFYRNISVSAVMQVERQIDKLLTGTLPWQEIVKQSSNFEDFIDMGLHFAKKNREYILEQSQVKPQKARYCSDKKLQNSADVNGC
jgi:glutamate--cysteine ligase